MDKENIARLSDPVHYSHQALCEDIAKMGDVMACAAFDSHGNVRGTDFGELEVDDQLKSQYSEIGAVIWGGIKRAEALGGPLDHVTVQFERFKILGIPIPKSKSALLVTLSLEVDSLKMRDRILDYLMYSSNKK